MHPKMTPQAALLAILLALLLTGCAEKVDLPALNAGDVVLAFGDSLTYGTGAKKNASYPVVLASLSGLDVVNAGVPGEISALGLKRLPGLLDEYQPKLLLLCHGGNDILRKQSMDKAAENITAMIKLAQARNIAVIMFGVPKFGLLLSPAEIYQQIAEQTGVVYIDDILADILSDKKLKSDTVHPNKDGYKIMAETIYELLKDNHVIQ